MGLRQFSGLGDIGDLLGNLLSPEVSLFNTQIVDKAGIRAVAN